MVYCASTLALAVLEVLEVLEVRVHIPLASFPSRASLRCPGTDAPNRKC
jgi:hypothetical protein